MFYKIVCNYMELNNTILIILGVLSIVVMVFVSIYFKNKINQYKEYGYLGIF